MADFVEPGPGEGVVCRGDGGGDGKGEGVGSVAERIGAHVARVRGGAAALDGLEDFEDGVFGRWGVAGEGDLTGASAVGGLALEADGLGAVDGHDVPLGDFVGSVALFAGPVGAGGFERVGVEGCGAVRDGLDQFDVGVGEAHEEGPRGRRTVVEMHFV